MIASVSGSVRHVGLDSVVVEVGGVGLLVHTTPATAAQQHLGHGAELETSLVVREDSLTLYGFADVGEKALFETVQKVSGVGPRLALAMLSVHAPDVLRAAIAAGDTTTLCKVPGIGKKGAERIVLELRDKVGALPGGTSAATPAPQAGDAGPSWAPAVSEALVGLGWSAKQADDAVAKVAKDAEPTAGTSAMLRAALQVLGR
ncbi:Holliday junction branch migration protein RuvA [Arsenicicoccus piscis]|uniref:Holliday junction branch migration complex subunit RuvA n=1 Tax=Arsenicicoccus piscis TaxID=673954 RepID=A0ABQ6HN47_9MICO|nr:Holliday junction branch migration protein RuvA [Arsenicicoccus piscis]MCH8628576.1 Holliday junction branch migration protein RuvA [Arsenicicoccus piscis]MCH8629210.1 Holliday junction branch migration protein RuvA [Arsenicicoccus piscis]GMA19836.1 Holliday junction ATP-dependent DNA helicase RuvA [Arsenicicoccus piscis]